jgi:hypothetical protein
VQKLPGLQPYRSKLTGALIFAIHLSHPTLRVLRLAGLPFPPVDLLQVSEITRQTIRVRSLSGIDRIVTANTPDTLPHTCAGEEYVDTGSPAPSTQFFPQVQQCKDIQLTKCSLPWPPPYSPITQQEDSLNFLLASLGWLSAVKEIQKTLVCHRSPGESVVVHSPSKQFSSKRTVKISGWQEPERRSFLYCTGCTITSSKLYQQGKPPALS